MHEKEGFWPTRTPRARIAARAEADETLMPTFEIQIVDRAADELREIRAFDRRWILEEIHEGDCG